MVDVHKRPFDVRQHLDPVLKLLAEVVRLPQRRARVHDDVNFDVVVRSAMICAHGIHFLDLVAERHRVVHEQLDKVAGRRLAGEQLELGVDGVSPSEHDTEGDEDTTHGVKPPRPSATPSGHEETEPVHEDIVAVVLPEHMDLTGLRPDRAAIEEEQQLHAESRAHGDDRRDVEFVGVLAAVVSNDSLHRLDNHDEVDRAHQESIDDISNCLQSRSAHWPLVVVQFLGFLVQPV